MKKILIASALMGMSCVAVAHNNECQFSTDFNIDINDTSVVFEKEAGDVKIHYSLDKLVRGRGWGSKIISLGLKMLGKARPIRLLAEVRTENHASRSVFSRLGFNEIESGSDRVVFRFDYK